MGSQNPRERLQRLFHKQDNSAKHEVPNTLSPPTSPPTPHETRRQVRKSSSRASLHDMARGMANSVSLPRGHRSSVEVTTSPEQQAIAQAAAAKAFSPAQDLTPPKVPPHRSNLSADMSNLTVSEVGELRPRNEDVAERNVVKRKPRKIEVREANADHPNGSGRVGNVKPLDPNNYHSENVADWNIVHSQKPLLGGLEDLPAPLKVKKRSSVDFGTGSIGSPVSPTSSGESHALSHKSNSTNLRRSQETARFNSPIVSGRGPKRSLEKPRIRQVSLDKPLPSAPSDEYAAEIESDQVKQDSGVGSDIGRKREYLVKDAAQPPDLKGIVDLSITEDTTLHERWAPAVTHETITRNVHEIREEHITREIHNHHVFHRILPIVDIEVLPARHLVPVEGGYAEISEDEVPGQTGANAQWLIAETVSKLMPKGDTPMDPRRFTARKFEDAEGDYKEYMAPEGFKRTETWWVHPPTMETGGKESGQTYPFYFNSPDPAKDGLPAKLPAGQIIGVSPLFAKQQRERMHAQAQNAEMSHSESDALP